MEKKNQRALYPSCFLPPSSFLREDFCQTLQVVVDNMTEIEGGEEQLAEKVSQNVDRVWKNLSITMGSENTGLVILVVTTMLGMLATLLYEKDEIEKMEIDEEGGELDA